jgi:hypothetical protein
MLSKVKLSCYCHAGAKGERCYISCHWEFYLVLEKEHLYSLWKSTNLDQSFENRKINSKLVSNCLQSLMILAECNRVQLLWVPRYKGVEGNGTAQQLVKKGLLHPFIWPEPACGTSDRVAWQVIRDWMCREHQDCWQSIPGQIHARPFFLSSLLKGQLSS